MKAIVTGGRGFIGSHLVDRLLLDGWNVTILDDLSSGSNPIPSGATFVYGKVQDDWTPLFSKEKFTHLFHLAAIPRVQYSIEEPIKTNVANVSGLLNMLEMCRIHGVGRFVFSSSSSVYGDQPVSPLAESLTPNPLSPYAVQKLIGEQYCKLYHQLYGLETVSLRYFNVYGQRQKADGGYATLIPKFINSYRKGIIPTVNGDGSQTRDFTFVTDVVNANMIAAMTGNKSAFGRAFNIGAGKPKSVNEAVVAIMNLAKSNVLPKYGQAVIEAKHSCASISESWKVLGWKPKVDFDDGIKNTYSWYERSQI